MAAKNELKKTLESIGASIGDLSRQSGLSPRTLRRAEVSKRLLAPTTQRKITDALNRMAAAKGATKGLEIDEVFPS